MIKNIIAETLGISEENISESMSPAECDTWTSKTHLVMLKRICDAYGVRVSIADVKKIHKIEDIYEMLRDKGVRNEDIG